MTQICRRIFLVSFSGTLLGILLLSGCINPVSTLPNGGEVNSGEEGGGVSVEEMTMTLMESALIIRIFPDADSEEAEKFCTAVAVSPNLLITSASCFKDGVRYAEVKRGAQVSFYNNEPRLGIISHVYQHPEYLAGFMIPTGSDIAILKMSTSPEIAATIPVVSLFQGDPTQIGSVVRIGYQYREFEEDFQRIVNFSTISELNSGVITFSSEAVGSLPSPCEVSGGLSLTFNREGPKLIGVSSYGTNGCTQGGAATFANSTSSNEFLNAVALGDARYPAENYVVTGGLECKQFFNCFLMQSCYAYLSPIAQGLMDQIYMCANMMGCSEAECFRTMCSDQYQLCIDDPPVSQ